MSGRTFSVLPPDRCLELLTHQVIGRVAWSGDQGVQVLPVTYAVHDQGIVFRTAPYGLLATLRDPCAVAFEVDRFDVDSRSGWSVVAQGRTRAVAAAEDLAELWSAEDPVPWAPGTRNLFITIAIDRLSGRIVGGV
ncbi:pyridoxamine 5'-phosphate oxidase family protein [Microlunatus sp. GCM10028923]|uniref:pyridoxamine 5'-phosphate oxidase family protein n=1 Tax=Microlunatus sp. GCM10028923 TaxID=3273400 RepID=UPI00361E37CD